MTQTRRRIKNLVKKTIEQVKKTRKDKRNAIPTKIKVSQKAMTTGIKPT